MLIVCYWFFIEKRVRANSLGGLVEMCPKRMRVQKKRWRLLLIPVPMLMIFVLLWLFWPRPMPASALEEWVGEKGFVLLKPIGADLRPGDLVVMDQASQQLYARLLDASAVNVEKASAIAENVTMQDHISGQGIVSLPGLTNSSIKAMGGRMVRLEASDFQILRAPIRALDQEVKKLTLAEPNWAQGRPLMVITEVLQVKKFKLRYSGGNNAKLDLGKESTQGNIALNSSFTLGAAGEVSGTEINIGYRFRPVTREGRVADPRASEQAYYHLGNKDLGPSEIQQVRSHLPAARLLGSEFQVFALCLGLGNYGGKLNLSGCADSTLRVRDVLEEMAGPEVEDGNVRVCRSVQENGVWLTKPYSKGDIMRQVTDFIEDNLKKRRPNRVPIIVFYYFGHGLATNMGGHIFLAPEDVVFKVQDDALDRNEDLVDLMEISEELKRLAPTQLFLIDACRNREFSEAELVKIWKKLDQNAENMQDMMNIVTFMSGRYGPMPIVLSSADGKPTEPVPVEWSQYLVGPVAVRLDQIAKNERYRTDGGLTIAGLLHELIKPQPSKPGGPAAVCGYSQLRQDFEKDLSTLILMGSGIRSDK